MSNLNSLYNDVAGAEFEGRDPKIDEAGDFIVENRQVRAGNSKDPRQGGALLWIVTFEILSGGTQENPNGARRAWVTKPNNYPQAKATMKAHICASLGMDPANKDTSLSADSVRAVYEDQVLYGTRVRLVTQRIVTQGSKQDFTVHLWYPVAAGEVVKGEAKPLSVGWQLHPDSPDFAWNPATNEVKPRGEVGL